MKKYLSFVVILAFISLLFPSKVGAFYENKVYCTLSKNSIVISLNAKDGLLCNKYIRSLELSMKDTYITILAIQKYIDKKEDLGYWKPLKEEKAAYLNSLQAVRLNILAHMKSFEQALLEQSKKYFLQSIIVYQRQLRLALSKLSLGTDIRSVNYTQQVQQQLDYIKNIAEADNFDVVATNLQKYLYLKKLLPGK